ncbi:MAG: DUF721 domain-containing protein [Nitrospinae bacterium]|nr:DUF721 domain-containing protein [Nitrospinota bacterium]
MKKKPVWATASQSLERILSVVGQASLMDFAILESNWPQIVGDALSRVSRPAELSRKRLVIWVKEPVWADSMSYLKPQIAQKANSILKKEAVTSTRITYRSDFEQLPTATGPKAREKEILREIPAEEAQRIDKELENVEDSELRAALKRVMLKSVIKDLAGGRREKK